MVARRVRSGSPGNCGDATPVVCSQNNLSVSALRWIMALIQLYRQPCRELSVTRCIHTTDVDDL